MGGAHLSDTLAGCWRSVGPWSGWGCGHPGVRSLPGGDRRGCGLAERKGERPGGPRGSAGPTDRATTRAASEV